MFLKLVQLLWRYFDVLCFILGAVFMVGFAFTWGVTWGLLALSLAAFFAGLLSELVATNKGGHS